MTDLEKLFNPNLSKQETGVDVMEDLETIVFLGMVYYISTLDVDWFEIITVILATL